MSISRTIFREYDVRGIVGKDLTPEVAFALGSGYAMYLSAHGISGAVAVGRDNRPSGKALRDALVAGLTGAGCDVVDVGVVPTPVLYWTLHNEKVVGGIQITGSHNPPEYNGFKMSVGTGSMYGEEIQRLYGFAASASAAAANADSDAVATSGNTGQVHEVPVIDRYIRDIVGRVGRIPHVDGKPLKVVYDCGNGVAALVAPALMEALGVDGIGLFTESDGTFPNHHPDPTIPENLEACIAAVREHDAHVGVAFDGDADRIGVIDRDGRIIWGDQLLILYARDAMTRTGVGQPVIFDVKCSQALPDAISQSGGVPVMWKTGHSLIKEKMKELHAPVAGEMSGHMFFSEGFYGHDDALYAAARLFRIMADAGKGVEQLLADVPAFVSTPEIRIDVDEASRFAIVERAVEHFRSLYDVIDVDGVRVLFGDGWGLLRASNTQPVIVARYEALTSGRLVEIRSVMESWLRSQGVEP